MERARRLAEEEFLLVVLLAAFGVVFVTVFPPTLLVADTWLMLVAGREVVENGLPSSDELTVLGLGRDWTDQQWGAQVVAYGAHALGGHGLLAVVSAAAVVAALAIAAAGARSLGAGPRAIAIIFFPAILAAPWAWTMRAQVFALPLFTGLLWLLASEARKPSRRAYLALPILVVWANIHGSVALAAMLTMLLGAVELVTSRGRSGLRSVALLVLPPLAVLATPYGPIETARYYHLLLVDPPFPRELVTEWRSSDLGSDTVLFYALAAAALVVVALGRRNLTLFDFGTLALTFVGAVTAIRGIPWFGLTCMVLLPVALGRRLEGKTPRTPRRADGILAFGAMGVLAVAVAVALVRDESWYVERWPEGAVAAVARHARRLRDPRLRHQPRRGLDPLALSRAPRPHRVRRPLRDLRRRDLRADRQLPRRTRRGLEVDCGRVRGGRARDGDGRVVAGPRLPGRAGRDAALRGRPRHRDPASSVVRRRNENPSGSLVRGDCVRKGAGRVARARRRS